MIHSAEITTVSGVEIESVRVRRGRNEQVRETTPWSTVLTDDGSHDETMAPHSRCIERNQVPTLTPLPAVALAFSPLPAP